MECLHYAYDNGIRWRPSSVSWAGTFGLRLKDLQWVIQNSLEPLNSETYLVIFVAQCQHNLVADMEVVEFLLGKMTSMNLKSWQFVEVLFLVNAMYVLEAIHCHGFSLGASINESEILQWISMGFRVSNSQPQGIKRNRPLKFRKVF
jgi:hypothetical protein